MTNETREGSYNGWTNYPTWCVNLWLGNDQGLYNEALDLTRETLESDHPTSTVWTVEESQRFNVADKLKDWVTDALTPDLGASFPADLLGWALAHVDWNEIADSWIESVRDQVTA